MNATKIKLLSTYLFLLLLSGCGGCSIYPDDMGATDLKYDFQAPLQSGKYANFQLLIPEGSGVAVDKKEGHIAIVGDEGALVFSHVNQLEILATLPAFEQGEDLEDVCFVGDNRIFVLRSDGQLYDLSLELPNSKDYTTAANYRILSKKVYKTTLTAANDAEGLCFDAKKDRLLIACKGPARIKGKDDKEARAVYAFDLKGMKLVPEPILVLRNEDLEPFIPTVEKPLDYIEPAAICISPTDPFDLYLLTGSTPGVLLLRYDPFIPQDSFQILRYEPIDPDRYTQPEGMAILAGRGQMLVADEIELELGTLLQKATRLHLLERL